MTVEILGHSCVAPSAGNADELFELLRQEICAVSTIPPERWAHARFWHPTRGMPGKAYTFAAGVVKDIYDFDPGVFGISAREASYMDPQQRLLLKTTWRALEDAGIPQAELQVERVGVYVGASSLDDGNLQVEDPASGSPHFMTGNTLSILSNRISHILGLTGPSMTIDTACSSSLVALHQAERALRVGEIDTAIVGGVNLLLHPFSFIGFSQARMLSPEGLCRAYGENGEGYVRAEGAGVVILRRTDRAVADGSRSHATIVASGTNSAGRTNGISLPSREAQAQLLRSIYNDNRIDPKSLAFIEGHGTGTKVGDPAELWAIGSVLGRSRERPLPIGSIKSNIGHAEPASGILGLIKAVLSLENDYLPASLHAEIPNASVDFEGLNVEINGVGRTLARDGAPRLAGINSFGFGGTNVHVVISDPSNLTNFLAEGSGAFTVSAHTQTALQALLEDYDALLSRVPAAEKAKIVSAARNRSALRHRFVVAGDSVDEIASALSSYLADGSETASQIGEVPGKVAKTAFVYAGNGSQWAGMGIDAYRENSAFRTRFDYFSQLFSSSAGIDISSLVFEHDLDQKLRDTRIAQPLLFAIQAALTDCLKDDGLKPDLVFGHSVGEVAAAYAAGILTAEDATTVVAIRSKHQHALAGMGTMAAVVMSEEAAIAFTQRHNLKNIKVAATNAYNSVTISGPVDEIRAFKAFAQTTRSAVHILDIDYPFHHPVIDGQKGAFLEEIPSLDPQTGHTVFISTVTGAELDGAQLDAKYWWRNVREPIAFEAAVNVALDHGCNIFMEISPRAILSSYVSETAKQASASVVVLPTLTRPGLAEGTDPVKRSTLRGIAHGAKVDFGAQHVRGLTGVDLPPLPFENASYRPEVTSDSINVFGRDGADGPYTLLGWRSDPNASVWKNHIDALLFPDLAGHVVDGKSIIPGSAFIEIAIQAARGYYGTLEVEITNLEIFRPLELRENRMSELLTRISPETGVIEISSREYMSEDGWTLHATARSRHSVGLSRKTELNVVPLGKVHSIISSEAYDTAKRFGLDYAPCFQLLDRAEVFDDKHIVVNLKPAAAPAHPYLTYGMDPVSTDAAFHGLVALFDRLTGEIDGAPYIPVRFGAIRTAAYGQAIASAVIQIQRFSANSLKARIELLSDDGSLVATLDDCRFRRTWLRQHSTLDTIAFHYEAVASQQVARHGLPNSSKTVFRLLAGLDETQSNEATLLLDASVQRACHDIARHIAGDKNVVSLSSLSGDAAFQCFLASSLYTLEDAGMAQFADDGWAIQSSSGLPSVRELLNEVYRRFPERVAETVLINNAYQETLKRLAIKNDGMDASHASFLSEATLDHVRHHTALGRLRENLVVEAVTCALSDIQPGDGFTIVEAGAVSTAFSNRLADMASKKGARLVIVEPSDYLRRTLEIGFERSPAIDCLAPDAAASLSRADLVVSACGSLYGHIRQHSGLKDVLRTAAKFGGQVVIGELPSSALFDFVFGLTENWFAESATPEFPVGYLAAPSQWEELLKEYGFASPEAEHFETAGGGLLVVQAIGSVALVDDLETASSFASILELVHGNQHVSLLSGGFAKTLECGPDNARETFDAMFEQGTSFPLAVVFTLPQNGDNSIRLQDAIVTLSAFAEASRAYLRGQSNVSRIRLLVVADGGSPAQSETSDANASGLWTFARVLQNEYEELDVVLLDAYTSNPLISKTIMSLLSDQSAEKEWVLCARTGLLSVIRAVPGYVSESARKTTKFDAATIHQQTSGRVDSIGWMQDTIPVPGAGEVVVKVAATGLNFRDVMWSMGLLPEEALEDGFAGATIGMEMAGTVIAVGENVTDLAVGNDVMGIGPKAFSTHMVVARDGVTKVPENIDLSAAATVPVAFLTAYYAMVELGRICEGETILIHGAAGGVGLAALQIAKLKGAKVIATAGTVEKRRYLTLLGADHVFDSRSLAFVGDVLRVTDGQGVELVLNSLFAEAMERSFELVKPFGRFLELGKRDYYSDRKLALRPFRRNISYFGIDADQLLVNAPELTRRIFAEIGALFAERKLTPLPYRAFHYDETGAAFRLMQNAGHIGKIVVRPPVQGRDHVQQSSNAGLKLSSGVYLVVGGIGGFGLETAKWLVSRGATHIALSTRGGVADHETLDALAAWKSAGVDASVHACDVTDESSLKELLGTLRSFGPLKGVVHAAMVLNDGLIANLDAEKNRAVIEVKALGASNLDRLTRSDMLDLFLLFSSATTMIGNPGQGNYVAANGYLEGLARARRREGLPALAIGFGAIADTGFLARNTGVNDMLSRRLGKTALKARAALGFVEGIMVNDNGAVDQAAIMVAELDWSSASALPITSQPLFSAIPRNAAGGSSGADGDQIDLTGLVAGKSHEEAYAVLHGFLAGEIAAILKVAEDSVKADKVLKDIGLDSLMAMELGVGFQQKTGIDISLSGMGDGATVGDIVQKLYEKVMKNDNSASENDAHEGGSLIEQLTDKHTAIVPERKLGQNG